MFSKGTSHLSRASNRSQLLPARVPCRYLAYLASVALALMEEMKQSMPCDETTFSNVVHGCAQMRDWSAAGRLLKDMRDAGLKPNDACYYALLAASSKAGELGLGERLLRNRRADGLSPDPFSYTTLFAGRCCVHAR